MSLPKVFDGFVTAARAAELLRVSPRRVRQFCEWGRAPGAFQIGTGNRSVWFLKLGRDGLPLVNRRAGPGRPPLSP